MSKFYVYGLFEPTNDSLDRCFYIGKGCGNRMNQHFHNCRKGDNVYKDRKMKKIKRAGKEPYSRKIFDNLTNNKAVKLEKELIKSIGIDTLTNILSEEIGVDPGKNHPMYGKSHSKETKLKIRKSIKNSDNIGGENHSTAKLSKLEAREVKWLALNSDLKQNKIADKYNISRGQVSEIKNNKKWKDIDPTSPKNYSMKITWKAEYKNIEGYWETYDTYGRRERAEKDLELSQPMRLVKETSKILKYNKEGEESL